MISSLREAVGKSIEVFFKLKIHCANTKTNLSEMRSPMHLISRRVILTKYFPSDTAGSSSPFTIFASKDVEFNSIKNIK